MKYEEIDQLAADQAREMDQQKRLAPLKHLHDLLRDDAIGSSLFGRNMIYA
jgi:hypothetical protein